jgi:hypothetical protein
MSFPERDNAEITAGQMRSWPDGTELGPASQEMTYKYLKAKHMYGLHAIADNRHGMSGAMSYVCEGCVQCKETGKRYT